MLEIYTGPVLEPTPVESMQEIIDILCLPKPLDEQVVEWLLAG